jgi:hypothetical protein
LHDDAMAMRSAEAARRLTPRSMMDVMIRIRDSG